MKSIYEQLNEIDDEASLTEATTKAEREMFDFDLFGNPVDHNYTEPRTLLAAASTYFGDRRHRVSNPSGSKSGDPYNDQHHDETRTISNKVTPVSHSDHTRIHQQAIHEVVDRITRSEAFRSSGWTEQDLANYLQWRAYKGSVEEYIKRRSDAYNRVVIKSSKQIQAVLNKVEKEYPKIVSDCTTRFLKNKELEAEQLKMNV